MDTKSIIAELQDLESGLCFLTEEHMEAIKAAWQIVERVDEGAFEEIVNDFNIQRDYPGEGLNSWVIAKAITDHINKEMGVSDED